ncbi:MAG: adenosylmethionine decarboxylase [Promethearchaeota archaeon]
MKSLGFHYLVELNECDPLLLKDAQILENLLQKAAKESGATEIGRVFHEFSPHGVSGVILISESHFSIHTWPEYGYAAVDFFTCSESVDVQKAIRILKENLHSKSSSVIEIKRGFQIS